MRTRATPRIFFLHISAKKACMKCERQAIQQGATHCAVCGLELSVFTGTKIRLPATGHAAGWRKLREWLAGNQPLLHPWQDADTTRVKRRSSRILPRMGKVQW